MTTVVNWSAEPPVLTLHRFNRRDVEAYVERGEKTNPLLLDPRLRPRRLFGRVHRAKVVA